MKALTWHGTRDVRTENKPDPTIQAPGDVIVEVTSTAICGSDVRISFRLSKGRLIWLSS